MKKICYIIGAGETDKLDFTAQKDDIVICADAGLSAARAAEIVPDLTVGDFDSFGSIPESDNVIVHPREKDETDSLLAVRCGIERGYENFVMYGMLGGRIDHSLANIQLIGSLSAEGRHGVLIGKNTVIEAVTNGERSFAADESGTVSVLSFTDISEGVTITGLKYEVKDAVLTNRFPIGVSNEFIGKKSKISVKNGTLLIIRITSDL